MSLLCMQVLELNQKLSELLYYSPYIMHYNPLPRIWTFYSYNLSSSRWFHFTWSFLTLFVWPISLIYIVLYKAIFSTVSLVHFFFSVIVIAPMILCNGLNLAFVISGDELTQYSNLSYKLGDMFLSEFRRSKTRQTIWMSLEQEFRMLFKTNPCHKVDFIGLLMTLVVIVLAVAPIFYFIGVCVNGVDQFSYIARLCFKISIDTNYSFLWLHRPQWLIFPVIALLVTMEVMRTLRTVFLAMAIPAEITLKLAKLIQHISVADIDKAVFLYRFVYEVHVKSIKSTGLLTFIAAEGGILASILSMTGTLIGWKIFPLGIYWIFPVMALLTLSIFTFTLPYATKSANTSLRLIHDWKSRVGEFRKGTKRYNGRLLKTLQPLGFYMMGRGIMFRETQKIFFTTILLNTSDCTLLAVKFMNRNLFG